MNVSINWQKYACTEDFTSYMHDLQNRYKQTIFHKAEELDPDYSAPMGRLEGLPYRFGLWMPGVALLAAHLKNKKNLINLYVAQNLEAFAVALKAQLIAQNNLRAVYIVSPSFSWCPLPINFPQHKVALGIEKTDLSIRMAILDSMPIGRQKSIDPQNLIFQQDLWEGYGESDKFNAPELICRAFLKASQGLEFNKEIYHSRVVRQKKGGCSIFALKDGISFLQNPSFFQEIEYDKNTGIATHNVSIYTISSLPIIHLLATQSLEDLFSYLSNKLENKMPIFLIKGKSIQEWLEKYLLEKNKDNVQNDKLNYYTTKKEIKYYTYVVDSLKSDPQKSKQLIDSTLLR